MYQRRLFSVISAVAVLIGLFWLWQGDRFYGCFMVAAGLVTFFIPQYSVFLNAILFAALAVIAFSGGNWKRAAVSGASAIIFCIIGLRFLSRSRRSP